VARAVAAQYANVTPVEHVYRWYAARSSLDACWMKSRKPRIVLFTCWRRIWSAGWKPSAAVNIPSLSIIGPVMQLFQAYLGAATTGRSARSTPDAEYFKRIDAAELHDDSMTMASTSKASKRPTWSWSACRVHRKPDSIYLANRGIRTANVPWCRALRSRISWWS